MASTLSTAASRASDGWRNRNFVQGILQSHRIPSQFGDERVAALRNVQAVDLHEARAVLLAVEPGSFDLVRASRDGVITQVASALQKDLFELFGRLGRGESLVDRLVGLDLHMHKCTRRHGNSDQQQGAERERRRGDAPNDTATSETHGFNLQVTRMTRSYEPCNSEVDEARIMG